MKREANQRDKCVEGNLTDTPVTLRRAVSISTALSHRDTGSQCLTVPRSLSCNIHLVSRNISGQGKDWRKSTIKEKVPG
jgi:hypothetical protein